MNRRNFLKMVGVSSGIVAAPGLAQSAEAFDCNDPRWTTANDHLSAEELRFFDQEIQGEYAKYVFVTVRNTEEPSWEDATNADICDWERIA